MRATTFCSLSLLGQSLDPVPKGTMGTMGTPGTPTRNALSTVTLAVAMVFLSSRGCLNLLAVFYYVVGFALDSKTGTENEIETGGNWRPKSPDML